MVNPSVLEFTTENWEELHRGTEELDVSESLLEQEQLPDGVAVRIVTVRREEAEIILGLWDGVPFEVEQAFTGRYGKIKELLRICIPPPAVFELIKTWDPRFRVFNFKDFDMVPTLEEYAELLKLPFETGQFVYFRQKKDTMHWLSQKLNLPFETMRADKGCVIGWDFEWLNRCLKKMKENTEWERFSLLSAILIYGLVLFPAAAGRVDVLAVDVLREVHTHRVNPIPAILAQTILSLNQARRGKVKKFTGCAPLLYAWAMFHMFYDRRNAFAYHIDRFNPRPLENFHLLEVPSKNRQEWKQWYEDLNSNVINWVVPWISLDRFIIRCGEFMNVPLLGPRGYVSYNPVLVMRQFGYQQRVPRAAALQGYEVHYSSEQDGNQACEILRAWRSVKLFCDTGTDRSNGVREGYDQWFQSRGGTQRIGGGVSSHEHYTPKQLWDYHWEIHQKDNKNAHLRAEVSSLHLEKQSWLDQGEKIAELEARCRANEQEIQQLRAEKQLAEKRYEEAEREHARKRARYGEVRETYDIQKWQGFCQVKEKKIQEQQAIIRELKGKEQTWAAEYNRASYVWEGEIERLKAELRQGKQSGTPMVSEPSEHFSHN